MHCSPAEARIKKNIQEKTLELLDVSDDIVARLNYDASDLRLPNGIKIPQLLALPLPSNLADAGLKVARPTVKMLDMPVDFINALLKPLKVSELVPLGVAINNQVLSIINQ